MSRSLCICAVAALLTILSVSGCSSSNSSSQTQPPPAVTISISPTSAAIGTGQTTVLQVTLTGDTAVTWTVNGTPNGNASVGTITTENLQGSYAAPSGSQGLVATIIATSVADTSKSATATVYVVPPGQVTSTGNTLVAAYAITPPSIARVAVQFGTDTTYGKMTSAQSASEGTVSTYVAGMRASTLYHMQAIVQFADGTQYFDADQTFTTGVVPATITGQIAATTTSGMTPQSGVELLDLLGGNAPVVATDLAGNIIWYYAYTASEDSLVQPVRMLPNGHFLVTISPNSSVPLTGPAPTASTTDEIREVDLAGNTIRSLNITDLNTRLAAAGFNLNALIIHHDAIVLPNGHWVFLVNSTQVFDNLTGYSGPTTVLGDAIVDVDKNLNPVWVWNTFNYLDANRHPLSFPDWTHSNALLYTSDGNLLLSVRDQNWILKIDYQNGFGSGNILWHFGEGGDFTLVGGTDPTDWQYAQHGPAFFTPNSSGTFQLGVMDNGDDRMFPDNGTCATVELALCPYTTVPIFQVNETDMTATLEFHDVLSQYSYFGGDIASLDNGDVEFDLCVDSTSSAASASVIYEVTQSSSPQVVWKMNITGYNAYRGFRMPSLYPGVQW